MNCNCQVRCKVGCQFGFFGRLLHVRLRIDHELLGGEAREVGFLVKRGRIFHQLVPARGGLEIDLDDPGIGRDLQHLDRLSNGSSGRGNDRIAESSC